MTWFAPVLVAEDRFGCVAPDVWAVWPAARDIGSAIAGPWSWDNTPTSAPMTGSIRQASRQPAGVRLSAPAGTVRRMAEAARALGRAESDVWAEAAREWLLRHEPHSPEGGRVPDGAPALAAPPIARRARLWRAIDDVLDTLRDDQPEARREPIPA
jgi:hypothetical protein